MRELVAAIRNREQELSNNRARRRGARFTGPCIGTRTVCAAACPAECSGCRCCVIGAIAQGVARTREPERVRSWEWAPAIQQRNPKFELFPRPVRLADDFERNET